MIHCQDREIHMLTEERESWCKTLVVGDEVAVRASIGDHYTILKIESITKSGRFKTRGYEFNPDGSIRKPDKWGPYSCEPVTQKIRDRIELEQLQHWIGRIKIEKLTADQIKAIKAIVEPDIDVSQKQ